jgi:hypothetical protein
VQKEVDGFYHLKLKPLYLHLPNGIAKKGFPSRDRQGQEAKAIVI